MVNVARRLFMDFRASPRRETDTEGVTSFGPTPIPQTPGAIQSSFIAQQANGPRAREKNKPQDAERPRSVIRDEVRISDPVQSEEIDPKPDAAEEWKHRRKRDPRREQVADPQKQPPGEGEMRLDIRA